MMSRARERADSRDAAAHGLGAFCAHARVERWGTGAGPLGGQTFAVKDVFDVEGVTACFGNPTWLATHAPATRTAPTLASLLAAGARLTGLTLTDELALSLTGENVHYGTPLNVRAPERVPGGSSAGSAAVVAAGLVDFALGTDTGGSVRVPASHCGVFGFRPSQDAVSTEGVWPLAPRFDTVGWFARDGATLARVGDVLLGSNAEANATAPPRLLLADEATAFLEPAARAAFFDAAGALAGRLARPLEPVAVGGDSAPASGWLATYLALQNAEAAALHGAWIARARPSFGSLIAGRLARALTVSPDDVAAAERVRVALDARATALLAPPSGAGGWLVWPSAEGAAPPRGLPDAKVEAHTGPSLALGALASLAGLPQVSLPLAEVEGCPFGVSLIGPRGADRALLAVAASLNVTGRETPS
jgi:amidase